MDVWTQSLEGIDLIEKGPHSPPYFNFDCLIVILQIFSVNLVFHVYTMLSRTSTPQDAAVLLV